MYITHINSGVSFDVIDDKLLKITKPTVQLGIDTHDPSTRTENSQKDPSESHSLWNTGNLKV